MGKHTALNATASDPDRFPPRSGLGAVLATLFLSTTGFGLTLPALPFFVERMALGPGAADALIVFHVGMLTSVYALSQTVFGPVLGSASDRWGRKPFLLTGLLGFAASQAVFGVSTALPMLYAARAVAGLCGAALLTVGSAAMADMAGGGGYLRAMAWRGSAVGAGIVVGPMLSGFLSRGNMHGHQMVGRLMLDGFSIPFLAAGGLALVATGLVAFWYREGERPHDDAGPDHESGPTRRVSIMDLLLLSAAAQLALSAFEATFALHAKDALGLGLVEIGWGYAVCGGVMAGLQGFLIGPRAASVGRSVYVVLGFSSLSLGLFGLAFSPSLPWALGSITVLAAGMGVLAPNLSAAVAERRPRGSGSSLGLQNTALGVGQVIGPLVGTLLFAVAPAVPFVATAALCGAISGLMWARRSRMSARSRKGE